jgi:hypothetical protein
MIVEFRIDGGDRSGTLMCPTLQMRGSGRKRRDVIEHARWLKELTDGACLVFLFFFVLLF